LYADRQLRRREQANKIRSAAATTLLKLDRWCDVSLSFFDKALVEYDDVKQRFLEKLDRNKNSNRHSHELLQYKADARKEHLDDHVEAGFADLYAYNSSIRQQLEGLLRMAQQEEQTAYDHAREDSEAAIGALYGTKKEFPPRIAKYRELFLEGEAQGFYRKLKTITDSQTDRYREAIRSCFENTNSALIGLIAKSDDDLLANSKVALDLKAECPCKPGCRAVP
jgi:hypothetical protein